MSNDKPMAAAGVVFAAMFLLGGLFDNLVTLIARDIGLWQFHATRSASCFFCWPVLAQQVGGGSCVPTGSGPSPCAAGG